MTDLKIAEGLSLPLDLVVQQSAILARTGAGKTNAATVIAEELLEHGQQVVIIDPPGAWWGLTASADGGSAGYPIVVLGGEHGDLPLPPEGGSLLADVVVDRRLSAILDLSDLSGRQVSTFVLAFAGRLYERKARSRSPMLLVIEEADEVAPQRAMPDQTRMLGAVERVVKRGRMRGIGTLMISQRSASLNKNVLSQAELLIAMQTTAPQDIKALDAWIEHHGDQEKRQQLLAEIATLAKGEAFVWSPAWLHEFRKIHFRLRRTFDSSATPKPGEMPTEPTARAEVDLERLREHLSTTIAEAEAADPKALQAKVRELERRLRERPKAEPEVRVERVEVPVITPELESRLKAIADDVAAAGMRFIDAANEIRSALVRVRPHTHDVPESAPAPTPAPRPERPARRGPVVVTPTDLSTPQVRILEALASFRALGLDAVARSNVAVFADQSPRSSGFSNNLGALRTRGLVDYPAGGRVAITEAGLACIDEPEPIGSLDDLHEAWYAKLSRPQGAILRLLVEAYPGSYHRDRLAGLAGQSPTSSGYGNNLGALRSLGLIDYRPGRQVAATDLLFPEGLR